MANKNNVRLQFWPEILIKILCSRIRSSMDLKIQGRQKWRKRRLKSELGSITSRCSGK